MTKKSQQKFKYLENEKKIWDEIKNNFPHFSTAFIDANEKNFLEGESPTLRLFNIDSKTLFVCHSAITSTKWRNTDPTPTLILLEHINNNYWERLSIKLSMTSSIKPTKPNLEYVKISSKTRRVDSDVQRESSIY